MPCSRQPLRSTTTCRPPGPSAMASGMDPTGHEAATGSRWAPVGSRGWPSSSLAVDALVWGGACRQAMRPRATVTLRKRRDRPGMMRARLAGRCRGKVPKLDCKRQPVLWGLWGEGDWDQGLATRPGRTTSDSPVACRPAVRSSKAVRGGILTSGMPTNLAWKHSTDSMTAVPPANGSPEREDDARLIERARAGDVEAFEHVYRREVGRVYALCLRMTADASRAREVTQSVFIRAWNRLGSFRGDSQLSSWLHRIAVNEVLVEARTDRRRRARVMLADDQGNEEIGAPSDAPSDIGITLPEDTETELTSNGRFGTAAWRSDCIRAPRYRRIPP